MTEHTNEFDRMRGALACDPATSTWLDLAESDADGSRHLGYLARAATILNGDRSLIPAIARSVAHDAGKWPLALGLVDSILPTLPRFSRSHFDAINLRFSLAAGQQPEFQDIYFSDDLVGVYNATAILGAQGALTLNRRLMAHLDGIGFVPNGHEKLGISGSDRQIVDYGSIDEAHPELRPFNDLLDQCVEDYSNRLQRIGAPVAAWRPEDNEYYFFAASTKRDAFHYRHIHTDCWLVATYYIEVPTNDDGDRVTLIFIWGDPNLRFRRRELRPREGRLVLFPAYMSHATSPARSSKRRVNLGVNIRDRHHRAGD